jgi:uncharacterized protein YabE (DUF348 family)
VSDSNRITIQSNTTLKTRWSGLILPLILAIASLLTVGYFVTRKQVKIIDGDRLIEIQTHRNTSDAILRDAGIVLRPQDTVVPNFTELVSHNALVVIKRARPVRVQIDDKPPQLILTQHKNASEMLENMGIKPTAFDRLMINGQQQFIDFSTLDTTGNSTIDIELHRAMDINIAEQLKPLRKTQTTAQTVGEALMQNGYLIHLADKVDPSPSERVTPGMHITIQPAKLVGVNVDGRFVRTRTHREKVSDVLSELNIILYDQDYTNPGINTPITDGMQIQVVRVHRSLIVEQDLIPFETRFDPNPDIELDVQVLGQEGQAGVRERRRVVTFENNVEIKRELVADFVAREPRPKIRYYGTKVVIRTLNTPSGPVNYWRKINVYATSYSPSTAGVSPNSPTFGIVRCGYKFKPGTIAVDPRIIPLRTNVYVEDYGPGVACDTGGGVVGKHVDLGYDDNSLKYWSRRTNVYLLTPVPANIRYVID